MHRHPAVRPPLRHSLLLALVALVPALLGAQERGGVFPGVRTPVWFVSAGTGFQVSDYIVDDASASTWDFDAGFMLRGSIEREIRQGVAVGLVFNYARLPMLYSSTAAGTTCTRCAADGTISSYGATVRLGGGPGLHQIVDLFLGAMRYGNFEQKSPRATLSPSSNTDLAFGAGYGFGYSLSNDWALTFVQDAVYALHERSTSPQAGGRLARHFTTRIGVRVGL
ncbi:MAG: hypothetical protein H7066_19295 [Cytophagaceae bacterium]|nr:hypothetical protein [Gemmatimonadaceae bacterium]